ncbi:MAG TPA: phosphopantetheine-binding protein [Verrucomicrobiae bacterium]|nr:phosphopantetheine-binding protein [Verrucomicrobiae bacterium]
MNATLSESDYADLKEGLRRCSPETVAAAIRYRESGDLAAIPAVVMGILERYQPAGAPVKLAEAKDDMRLIEELGLDSLTLLEIVMSIEEVLKLRIENEELREIRTLGQLKDFLQAKISGKSVSTAGRHYSREQIALILPQQPPFLFLDSAELQDASAKGRYLIKGDEFFLEGHFKDEPVFPASIVFEAMGQTACLWVLEKAQAQTGKAINSNQVYFASLDGAHFQRKAKPGEQLEFELKLSKLREPLAVFEGIVTTKGEPVARIERLVLAFGDPLQTEKPAAIELAASRNGHH